MNGILHFRAELKMKLIRFYPLKTKELLSATLSNAETIATLNNEDEEDNDDDVEFSEESSNEA